MTERDWFFASLGVSPAPAEGVGWVDVPATGQRIHACAAGGWFAHPWDADRPYHFVDLAAAVFVATPPGKRLSPRTNTLEEAAFQAALDRDPADDTVRLVFADWLDERGDPRGPGYRALAGRRRRPLFVHDAWPFHQWSGTSTLRGPGRWEWWSVPRSGAPCDMSAVLPAAWLRAVDAMYVYTTPPGDGSIWSKDFFLRRHAEDTAAEAFSRLGTRHRREILAPPKRSKRSAARSVARSGRS